MYAKTRTRKMQSDKHKLHSGSVTCFFMPSQPGQLSHNDSLREVGLLSSTSSQYKHSWGWQDEAAEYILQHSLLLHAEWQHIYMANWNFSADDLAADKSWDHGENDTIHSQNKNDCYASERFC